MHSPGLTAEERECRLPIAHFALQGFAIGERYIRRIGNDDIRDAVGEGFEEVGFEEIDICAEFDGIRFCDFERLE